MSNVLNMFILSKGSPSTANLIMQSCTYAGEKRVGNTYIQDGSDGLLRNKEGKY